MVFKQVSVDSFAQTFLDALPDYSIRQSLKAKNVRIVVSIEQGVVVVVPQGFDLNQIPELLQQKRRWLQSAWEQIEARRNYFQLQPPTLLPEQITLRAIEQEWIVEYQPRSTTRLQTIEQKQGHLILQGHTTDCSACQHALQRWVNQQAQIHLIPWLQQLSESQKLPFAQVTIRGQKTRWGSCSSRKTISLNRKLLFLPRSLVHYVLIHELSHTIHMNHSKQFWSFVRSREPHYQELDAALREAWRYVPTWMNG